MQNMNVYVCAILSALCWAGFANKAQAHPHVFIESETEVLLNTKHQITGFRHKWVFDSQYTAFALVGMDVDKDGKYSPHELEPLAKENIESLHEYDFFTHGTYKGKAIKLENPTDYKLTYINNVLALEFTLLAKQPVSILGNPLKLAIYDPEFFIAFLEPKKQKEMRLASTAPKNCMFEKRKAAMDQTNLVESRLGQPMDLSNDENIGAGAFFAPSFHISCLTN